MAPKQKLPRHASKLHPVPLGLIKVPPAGVTQRPELPSLIDKLVAELDLDKLGFPVMNHRGGVFWCIDGQHRIKALIKFGFALEDTVQCEVFEGLTDEQMACIFLGRDDRRAIAPFHKFLIACTAGRVRETAIRRVVEAHGLKIDRARTSTSISAVGALNKIYDTSPAKDIAIGWVVRVARGGFNGDPKGFDAIVLDALGLIFNRHGARMHEKELIVRLSNRAHGLHGLLQRMEAEHTKHGRPKTHCLAKEIVETYNRGLTTRSPSRLPPWWRVDANDATDAHV